MVTWFEIQQAARNYFPISDDVGMDRGDHGHKPGNHKQGLTG